VPNAPQRGQFHMGLQTKARSTKTLPIKMPVFVDDGVRRGNDVVKAIATGVSAVVIGCATLYGVFTQGARVAR
jgi:isopentenyl diphosphate isomerase/L-lactate dehydrogenase-like FMN-dependent dehydrogenase